MTSKIKVDNINKVSDDSNIIKKCGSTTTVGSGSGTIVVDGSTVTLGRCGGTVALASGATQTGFGRTGTVDWQTGSIKTATFTAANGEGYFCNTGGGAFELDLPAGSAGAIVSLQDYNNTFDTANLTVDPNGSEKINGGEAGAPIVLATQGQGATFVYIDSTIGWRSVQDNTLDLAGSNYISASGGTETTCGDFKIHTFTGPGTFTVSAAGSPGGSDVLEYLVVAGGGGGGRDNGGGGGAGGFRFASPTLAPLTFPAKPLNAPAGLTASTSAYPIVVGAGGGGGCAPCGAGVGKKGSDASFSTITSAGGGGGGTDGGSPYSTPVTQTSGGSGGASGQNSPTGPVHPASANSGNTPPVSPSQGNPGGRNQGSPAGGGGGGGAIAAGGGCNSSANGLAGGDGGGLPTGFGSNGVPCGSFRYYAGGAGGGVGQPGSGSGGAGGKGGGAAGGPGSSSGSAATANSGGGGGGGGQGVSDNSPGSGGSGIVVIRYKFQN